MNESSGRRDRNSCTIDAGDKQGIELTFDVSPGFIVQHDPSRVRVGGIQGEVEMSEGSMIVSAYYNVMVCGEVDNFIGFEFDAVDTDVINVGKEASEVINHSTKILFGL